ncbi:hypothetical protein BN1708_017741, partial [Verticillium longisporum]
GFSRCDGSQLRVG